MQVTRFSAWIPGVSALAAETAIRQIEEIDASISVVQSELEIAQGNVRSAEAALGAAEDNLSRRKAVQSRNPSLVSEQEIADLEAEVESRRGAVDAARAGRYVMKSRLDVVLPAQRASAEAVLAQTRTEISKATVYAGIDGTVQQFKLKPGDIVNPILRPAGILVPASSGRGRFQAGFGQISAQVLKVGMVTEITCASMPLTVIPMVVTEIQGAISTGQLRPTDQLIDIQDRVRPWHHHGRPRADI